MTMRQKQQLQKQIKHLLRVQKVLYLDAGPACGSG